MTSRIQVLFVFLIAIASMKFFDARFFDQSLLRYIVFITISSSIAFSIPYIFARHEGFVFPIQLIVLSVIISVFMSYISWDQPFKDSLIETVPCLLWIFFFYLLHIKIPVIYIKRMILIYGGLYALLYFYQLAHADTVLFGSPLPGDEIYSERRGIIRIMFPGGGIFTLAAFMAINKLTSKSKGNWIWIIFSILGIVIPVLQVTRQFIAGVLIIYLFHLLTNLNIVKRLVVLATFSIAFIYVANSGIPMIEGMIHQQKEDSQLGQKYIRILAGSYFIHDFSPNMASRIFGNGMPSWGISDYGVFVENLADKREYYLEDVGIVAFYAMFGILGIIGYVIIWIKSFTIPLPKDYYFLKYYLWYLLMTSLTGFGVYHYSYLIATVFVLYIYQSIYVQQKRLKEINRLLKHNERIKNAGLLSTI